jgi:hypothetical protein
VGLARWPYDDFHVLPERGEEVHEAFDGKSPGAVAHQCGDMRLLDAENLSGFCLLEAAPLDEAVDLKAGGSRRVAQPFGTANLTHK